ncbi:MAG: transcription antitermination factor NusB [Bacteroidales bacterium]
MINRWIIRNKVLHLVYASRISSETSINKVEKELLFSIDKLYELAHLLIEIPLELRAEALRRIEQGKSKRVPTQTDLNPNTNFVDNKLIQIIENNIAVNNYISKKSVNWTNYDKFIKDLFARLSEWAIYQTYINKDNLSFKDQSKFIEKLFNKFLPMQEELAEILEEKSIYWNDDLEFTLSILGASIKKIKEDSDEHSIIIPPYKNDEQKFAKELFRSAVIYNDNISEIIQKHTLNWDMERIAQIDLVILQLALAEILYIEGVPVNVSINEYIEISKHYSSAKSSNFINGVLDNAVKALKKSGELTKI